MSECVIDGTVEITPNKKLCDLLKEQNELLKAQNDLLFHKNTILSKILDEMRRE